MRIRAGFGVGRDPSLTACPGLTCCHECFSALQVSLHLSESHQHSAPEDGVVPSVVLRDADREGGTARVGHVGQLPALYSAEFISFGRCSFLLRCWQGQEEVSRVLPLILAKIRAVGVFPRKCQPSSLRMSWESPSTVLPLAALPV